MAQNTETLRGVANPRQKLFIGIDLGTSGCRAVAINTQGAVKAEATAPLPTPTRDGPRVQQRPDLWWQATCQCLDQLAVDIGIETDTISAIAVDGTSATLLLTNETGNPLGPALIYNDARAGAQAEAIARVAPDDSATQGPSSALAKLLWLKDAGQTEQAAHVVHQADWISWHLRGARTEHPPTSDFNNALKMGFDARALCWPTWFNQLAVPTALLPEVIAPGTPTGTLTPALAERFGFPANTRIIAGTTDSTASFLATGARKVGEAVTALGSTLVVKVIARQPVFAAKYGVYSQPLIVDGRQRWLVGGASNSGGAVLRQFFDDEQMRALTPQLQPETPTGLNYYPLPAPGERFPVCDPSLAPRLTPRPPDDRIFFQGILEGIAHIEARAYRLLAELGAPYPIAVRSTGGGAHNVPWTRVRERALAAPQGNPIMATAQHTEAAYGAALLARQGADKNISINRQTDVNS
ncbi:MAG: FGGY-family carbohydrate kinase [Gammaproteobacteria bacterium]|nr:FGGY-family carbohydrate kinase [Gammaproteobacteria bacterium]